MGWSDADALGVGESSQGMDANPVGMGLGSEADVYDPGWFNRALAVALNYYGGNHSLLGHNKSILGQKTAENPTGAVSVTATPSYGSPVGHGAQLTAALPTVHNSELASVIANNQNLSHYGHGGHLANNLHSLGIGPNYSGIGMNFGGGVPTDANPNADIDGGSDRPWWLENTNSGQYGMMNPETGIWNDWDRPYTGSWPPINHPPQLETKPIDRDTPWRTKDFDMHVRPAAGGPSPWSAILGAVGPYIRKKHPLAYENAYNMWEGGDGM